MKMRCDKVHEVLLEILMVLMPFHSIIFSILGNSFLTLWRDIIILILYAETLKKRKFKLYKSKEDLLIISALIFCSLHAILFHEYNMPFDLWVNSLRIYLIGFMPFFIGKYLDYSKKFILKLKKIYIIEATTISIWGIFQMFVLGRSFLYSVGYGISSAVLANGFQRNVGLFSSANLMGVFVGIAILIVLYGEISLKHRNIVLIILSISLILTFSTSAVLGLISGILYKLISKIGLKKFLKLSKRGFKIIAVAAIGFLACYILDKKISGGYITCLISNRVNEFITAITISDLSRTTSASVHLDDLIRSIDIVKDNFWGVGFSRYTFILLNRVAKKQLLYLVESSLFTVLFDFGIIVGISYFLPFIYPLFLKSKRLGFDGRTSVTGSIFVMILLLYVFLPLVSSIELRFYAFLFLGFDYNRAKVNRIYRKINVFY